MEITKRLLMSFLTAPGKRVSISVDDPRADLTEAEIKTAMSTILSKNIFKPGGENFASLVEAKVVETGTTEYDLIYSLKGKLQILSDSINELSKNIIGMK